jgi:exonuclease SbcC
MRLIRLRVKNIRSYEDQEIAFPEGSLLLSGDVGSGKTTLLLAIEYALFGLQPGQKGSALLRNNSEIGEVSLELEIEGKEIIIERRIKRGKSVTNDYASITINGKKFESSITEVKTRILNLMGYPAEFIKKNNILYRYTVYTPQEQMKRIILEEPDIRLDVLRHVFNVDKYKRIRENLALLLNKIKENSRMLQAELLTLEKDKELLANIWQSQALIKDKISLREDDLKLKYKRRKAIEEQFAELESKLKEKMLLESEIEKATIMISSKKESLLTTSNEIKDISSTIAETKEFKQDILEAIGNLIIQRKSSLEFFNNSLINLSGQTHSLQKAKNEALEKKEKIFSIRFCPTCLQNVPDAHKHNILNETESKIVDLNKSLDSAQKALNAARESISKEKKDLELLEEERNKLLILKSKSEYAEKASKRLAEIIKLKGAFEKDIELLNKHIDGLKEQVLIFSKFDSQIKANRWEFSTAQNEEKALEIAIAELKKELAISQSELKRLEKQIAEKLEKQAKLNRDLELADWLSNQFSSLIEFTERNVLIRLRKEFSDLFRSWFLILAGEGLDVHLDENFTPIILQGEFEMDYSFLSGGERTAVALAYRLALNQTINSLLSMIKTRDIIILDEPTEGFSEVQIDKIRDIFQELNVAQLIVVSHEQKIEGFVDNVMKIRKAGSISSILPSEQISEKPQNLNTF